MKTSARSPDKAAFRRVRPILLDSDFRNLAAVRRWLRAVCAAAELSKEGEGELMVAVGEAVTNCMKHAYHGSKNGRIVISSSLAEGMLNIHIRDWGDKFHTELYNAPDLGEAHEGGYGVFLMREMTDGVEICTDNPQGTEVILRKRLTSDGESDRL